MAIIEVHGLVKRYGDRTAVNARFCSPYGHRRPLADYAEAPASELHTAAGTPLHHIESDTRAPADWIGKSGLTIADTDDVRAVLLDTSTRADR